MTYLAHYGNDGTYLGFYLEELHGGSIPSPTIPLTEQQWLEARTGDYKVVESIHTYLPTSQSPEEELANILQLVRSQRNQLLVDSDWTQFTDSPLSSSKKTEWAVYRQQLRDITDSSDITAVEFPLPPL